MKTWIPWILMCVVGAVSGCNTPNPIPVDKLYVAPKSSEEHATIRGSKSLGVFGFYTAYVREIDGKKIPDAKANSGIPILLTPGRHVVRLAFYKAGLDVSYDETLDVQPEKNYEVRSSTSMNPLTGEQKCDVWVVDQRSGEMLTPVRGFGADGVPFPIMVPIPSK
jgi:hypothetical protein